MAPHNSPEQSSFSQNSEATAFSTTESSHANAPTGGILRVLNPRAAVFIPHAQLHHSRADSSRDQEYPMRQPTVPPKVDDLRDGKEKNFVWP
jgi:hypothetical protein